MKFKKISEKENEMIFEIQGEDNTFAGMLASKILENKDVESASYDIPHPLTGSPVFYIKTKKGEPRDVVKKALTAMKKDVKALA